MTNMRKVPLSKANMHPLNAVSCLWTLRILLDLNGIEGLLSSFVGIDDDVLRTIGMDDIDKGDVDKKSLINKMKHIQKDYEAKPPVITGVLNKNIIQLGRLLG